MAEMHSKRLVQHDILEILKTYSDSENKLSQMKILGLLKDEYGITVDRKTVKRHLSALYESDEEHIQYNEGVNRSKEGHTEEILSGWYYRHDFSEGELLHLIECVMFSEALPKKFKKELITNLKGLSNRRFHGAVQKIETNVGERFENCEFFLNLEIIGEAVSEGKKISFVYNNIGADLKLHPVVSRNGEPEIITVSPYQVVKVGGYTYLLCKPESSSNLEYFRIDRITSCDILRKPSQRFSDLPQYREGIRMSDYMRPQPGICTERLMTISLRCSEEILGDVVDAFGTGITVIKEKDGMLNIRVQSNEDTVLSWALRYADKVEITSPESLRTRIKEVLCSSLKKYA